MVLGPHGANGPHRALKVKIAWLGPASRAVMLFRREVLEPRKYWGQYTNSRSGLCLLLQWANIQARNRLIQFKIKGFNYSMVMDNDHVHNKRIIVCVFSTMRYKILKRSNFETKHRKQRISLMLEFWYGNTFQHPMRSDG